MRDDKDRISKWLIEHHGGSILRLGGVSGFRAWRAGLLKHGLRMLREQLNPGSQS